MARKNLVASFQLISAGAMTGSITSSTVNVQQMDKASIHLVWSGASGTSTVTVEARNGALDSWYTLDFGSAITISTASGDHQIQFTELPFTDIRVKSTAIAAGTLNARITMKQVGG